MNKHESGYTLVGVLAIFTISSIIAISLVMISVTSLKASKTEVDNQAVFYIAEAGLNKAVNKLEKEIKEIDERSQNIDIENEISKSLNKVMENTNNLTFEKVNNIKDPPSVQLVIKDGKEKNEYIISSTGIIDNQKRTVEQTIEIDLIPSEEQPEDNESIGKWSPFKDYGVYAFGNMVLDGGVYSKDIGTANNKEGSITLKNGVKINKEIKIPEDNKSIVQGNTSANITQYNPLKKPSLPNFPTLDDDIWKSGNICGEAIQKITGKNYIKLVNIQEIPYHCTLYIMDSNPEAELNILIDPANIGGKKTLTIMTLNIYTDAKNRTPVNLYVNGNIQFPRGSTGGNIHANIYTKGDVIVKSGASGINFHGSLFSKEGNIELEKGHSASEFYGELVYAQNNITFGSPGIIMHGTSVIGNSVNLTNTTINTIPDPNLFPDPHRIKSGSLPKRTRQLST